MKRQILIGSLILLFTAGFATADTIHVPGAFPYIDIQQAIDIAQNNGDTIVIAPGTYVSNGYVINKNLIITGEQPQHPELVVIDLVEHRRGFELNGFGGGTCVLKGLTIANGYARPVPSADGPVPGAPGNNGYDRYGIGILINGNHIVTDCIVRNCQVIGGLAGDGADGDPNGYPGDPCDPPVPVNYGGNGGYGGHAYGGGICISSGNPQIINTIVEDCVAIGGDGGAGGIGLEADTGDPPDGNLPGGPGGDGGNGGNAMGGGIYCHSGNPTFENCIIRNCQAYPGEANDGGDGGDGITEDYHPATPTGGKGGYGGVPGLANGAGVYCDNGVIATFNDCQFIGNRAYGSNGGDGGDGGAVHTAMSVLWGGLGGLVEQSQSEPGSPQGNNPPSNYSAKGAGVYIENGSTATFTGCAFSDNVTRGSVSGLGGFPSRGVRVLPRRNFRIPSYGAGIFADQPSTIFTDCNVQGNWTTREPNQYPGDLYPYGSHPDPGFELAGGEHTGYGAGMCFIGGILGMGNFGYVELNNCYIADNNAPVGGGVCASALTDFHVDECNFVGNSAYFGGGLFSIDNFSTISMSNFIGNRAYDPNEDLYGFGGGIFSFSSDIFISDCNISKNTTNGFGAGIYMSGEVAIPPLTAEPVLKNCLLSNNEAGFDGGGIYCDWYSEPNIINCTITGNEARGNPPLGVGYGGGLYCSYESDVNITNSIVWGNAGPNTIGPELAVETWAGFGPTTLTVSYCDIKGGQGGAWVDDDSTLNWGAGNINEDPLFVGGYYLSQTDANSASYPGQDTNSLCVDAGSDLAANLGLQNYTTRTDSVPDVCDVDMGYHYPLIIPEVSCDFDANGVVNLADLAILLSYWLVQDCDLLAWCEGTDLDRDTDVDFVDYAIFAQCYALSEGPPTDTDPPDPDPSTWEIEPYEISDFVISMTATTATDVSGLVEYLFERVSIGGEPNDVNSGWLTEWEWEDTVTADETTYCYTVKTRDLYFNETLPSVERCVWIDHTAPWPDPSEWEIEPHPLSSSAIHMMAVTAYDPSGGVQYQFECVSGGGHSSDWQDSPEYTDTGLAALTEYTYRVRTRDVHENTGDYSDAESATTLPE